jgi:hypothetical protein
MTYLISLIIFVSVLNSSLASPWTPAAIHNSPPSSRPDFLNVFAVTETLTIIIIIPESLRKVKTHAKNSDVVVFGEEV